MLKKLFVSWMNEGGWRIFIPLLLQCIPQTCLPNTPQTPHLLVLSFIPSLDHPQALAGPGHRPQAKEWGDQSPARTCGLSKVTQRGSDRVNYGANLKASGEQFPWGAPGSPRNFKMLQWALTQYFSLLNIWKMTHIYNRHSRETGMKQSGSEW